MDTALFYPTHLHLSEAEAKIRVSALVDTVERFGGAFTVNWHDRSTAPERQWGEFYSWLVAGLKTRGAWFATASQAVSWFERRRSAKIEITRKGRTLQIQAGCQQAAGLPRCRVRLYRPEGNRLVQGIGAVCAETFVDFPLSEDVTTNLVI